MFRDVIQTQPETSCVVATASYAFFKISIIFFNLAIKLTALVSAESSLIKHQTCILSLSSGCFSHRKYG